MISTEPLGPDGNSKPIWVSARWRARCCQIHALALLGFVHDVHMSNKKDLWLEARIGGADIVAAGRGMPLCMFCPHPAQALQLEGPF